MKCHKGIFVNAQGGFVPCGQCMPCRINKGRLWSARILMEQAFTSEYAFFATLTYNDDKVPKELDDDACPVPSLRKKSFLKWVDNTAQQVSPFRYYAIGEYGDNTLRPHYHLAIFPSDAWKVPEILGNWKKGFTSHYELNPARARYLANYTTKKLTKATDSRLKGNQEPEFRTSSRNPPLGAACVDSLCAHYSRPTAHKIIEERGDVERSIRLDGKIYPLGNWALGKIRKAQGIPLLHRERLAHPNYLDFHDTEEAICDHDAADKIERLINAKTKQGFYRGKGQKV